MCPPQWRIASLLAAIRGRSCTAMKTQHSQKERKKKIFIGGLVMWASSVSNVTKFQTHRRNFPMFSISCICGPDSLSTASHRCWRAVGILLGSRFPNTSEGSDLQAGLSKDSILRPDMIRFLCSGVYRSLPFCHKCICCNHCCNHDKRTLSSPGKSLAAPLQSHTPFTTLTLPNPQSVLHLRFSTGCF